MTSAEPAQTAAYSTDIRWRVVWQRVGMGLTFQQIASRLQIGITTAYRVYQRYVATGDVAPKPVSERPHCTLHELYELYVIAYHLWL